MEISWQLLNPPTQCRDAPSFRSETFCQSSLGQEPVPASLRYRTGRFLCLISSAWHYGVT